MGGGLQRGALRLGDRALGLRRAELDHGLVALGALQARDAVRQAGDLGLGGPERKP